ncbi:hypothetical protein LSTR_LSTR002021 [Laodelphax striatellus]|uniref:Uncharacterized protein n=1 Tax=Laodelphax striatellus TaxID=195883 RepID=A0A482XHQ7_LAOST|nr:hypothetical protein LSTR_LSTR002021 [Laodelphax striatellus]
MKDCNRLWWLCEALGGGVKAAASIWRRRHLEAADVRAEAHSATDSTEISGLPDTLPGGSSAHAQNA